AHVVEAAPVARAPERERDALPAGEDDRPRHVVGVEGEPDPVATRDRTEVEVIRAGERLEPLGPAAGPAVADVGVDRARPRADRPRDNGDEGADLLSADELPGGDRSRAAGFSSRPGSKSRAAREREQAGG